MRLSITAYLDKEEDGYSGSVSVDREDVADLTTIAQAFKDFLLGCGYDYVSDVGICSNNDKMFWGETL